MQDISIPFTQYFLQNWNKGRFSSCAKAGVLRRGEQLVMGGRSRAKEQGPTSLGIRLDVEGGVKLM